MARDTVRHVLVVGFRRQFFLERLDLVWSRSFSVVSLNHHCFSSALLPGRHERFRYQKVEKISRPNLRASVDLLERTQQPSTYKYYVHKHNS